MKEIDLNRIFDEETKARFKAHCARNNVDHAAEINAIVKFWLDGVLD